MLINEERTWERKRQLEMETALQENTEMVTERVTEQVSEQMTRSFIESLILDGSMTEGQIARITKVSVDFVQRLKKGLAFG